MGIISTAREAVRDGYMWRTLYLNRGSAKQIRTIYERISSSGLGYDLMALIGEKAADIKHRISPPNLQSRLEE